MPPRPVTANPSPASPIVYDELEKISIQDLDDPEEIAPHLRGEQPNDVMDLGPVPPIQPGPHAQIDPYVRFTSPLPRSQIIR